MFRLNFQMEDRMIRVHPNPGGAFACLLLDLPRLQLQRLSKGRRGRVWIWPSPAPYPAQLEQLSVFTPGIGFGDEEHNISLLFRPNVERDVAVAKGHRVVFVCAEGIPRHIVCRGEAGLAGECEQQRERKGQAEDGFVHKSSKDQYWGSQRVISKSCYKYADLFS